MTSTLRPVALLLTSAALGSVAFAQIGCSSADGGETSDEGDSLSAALTGTAAPIVSALASKCLDDSSDSTANGTRIQLYSCNKSSAQNWAYTGGAFVGPGGKCLDIRSDGQVPGATVQLYGCNGTNAQKWTIAGKAIKSTAGLCLDVTAGSAANGTPIQLYGCNGNPSQQWDVTGLPHTADAGVDAAPDAARDAGKDAAPDSGKPSSGPTLRQYNVEQTSGTGGSEGNSTSHFKMPTEKGSTIWVAATLPNDGQQNNVKVQDTQGNSYIALDTLHDTGRGAQTVWHFYATDIKGDGAGAPDAVTVVWGGENYKGILITEVAGASAASLVGHAGDIQTEDAPAGTNGVTSGTIAVSAADAPALLVSLSMDTYGGYSDESGDTFAGPLAGSGFTAVDALWNWDPGQTCTGDLSCTLAQLETQAISGSKTAAGLFTARAPKGSATPGTYVTVAAVFH